MEIQILKKHGYSLRKIAQEVGCSVNTVRSHLACEEMPSYRRKVTRETKLARYESYLKERQESAKPHWIPATVLYREIVALGYQGGQSQLCALMRTLKPSQTKEPLIRFETAPGEQMQVDWVEFRKGKDPLYAFCATLGYSRSSYVEFVNNMQVETLIECHQNAFNQFGGVPQKVLYDNMKTIVLERDVHGDGQHRYHAGFLDYAKHSGFLIKLCRPYRAKTKGKVERFNGYLRRSFYVPLNSRIKQAGGKLDLVTANNEVTTWLKHIANERLHGTTDTKPSERLKQEQPYLQPIGPVWRGAIAAARPQDRSTQKTIETNPASTNANMITNVRPATVMAAIEQPTPQQHPLAVYEQLLSHIERSMAQGAAA
jgi:transposase